MNIAKLLVSQILIEAPESFNSRFGYMAGARGIEPRSRVLETLILTVVLCPYDICRLYGKHPESKL